MNNDPVSLESNNRKYEPPKVVTISLRPEEAVLGHCKLSGSAGPTTASCVVLFCSSIGS
jgi:hypothetical protein